MKILWFGLRGSIRDLWDTVTKLSLEVVELRADSRRNTKVPVKVRNVSRPDEGPQVSYMPVTEVFEALLKHFEVEVELEAGQ